MRVYLAAPYAARDQVRSYANDLEEHGVEVTSTWLEESHEINPGTINAATALGDDEVAQHVRQDLADIRRSDVLVLFTADAVRTPGGSGGRHVETGYFMALFGTRNVIVVGEPENVFHRAAGVTRVKSWGEALTHLAERASLAGARR